MTTYHLERIQRIPKPRAEVFRFFADATNLERITPAFLHFQILTPRPIEMQAGTLIDYRLRLYGLPVYWRTRIESFEPESSFTDTQEKGPYRLWHHRHDFADVAGGTEMSDRVDYELPLGALGGIARQLFVRRALERIFDHRCHVIQQLLGA